MLTPEYVTLRHDNADDPLATEYGYTITRPDSGETLASGIASPQLASAPFTPANSGLAVILPDGTVRLVWCNEQMPIACCP